MVLFLGHHHSAKELAQESRTPTAPTTTPNRLTIFGLSHLILGPQDPSCTWQRR